MKYTRCTDGGYQRKTTGAAQACDCSGCCGPSGTPNFLQLAISGWAACEECYAPATPGFSASAIQYASGTLNGTFCLAPIAIEGACCWIAPLADPLVYNIWHLTDPEAVSVVEGTPFDCGSREPDACVAFTHIKACWEFDDLGATSGKWRIRPTNATGTATGDWIFDGLTAAETICGDASIANRITTCDYPASYVGGFGGTAVLTADGCDTASVEGGAVPDGCSSDPIDFCWLLLRQECCSPDVSIASKQCQSEIPDDGLLPFQGEDDAWYQWIQWGLDCSPEQCPTEFGGPHVNRIFPSVDQGCSCTPPDTLCLRWYNPSDDSECAFCGCTELTYHADMTDLGFGDVDPSHLWGYVGSGYSIRYTVGGVWKIRGGCSGIDHATMANDGTIASGVYNGSEDMSGSGPFGDTGCEDHVYAIVGEAQCPCV